MIVVTTVIGSDMTLPLRSDFAKDELLGLRGPTGFYMLTCGRYRKFPDSRPLWTFESERLSEVSVWNPRILVFNAAFFELRSGLYDETWIVKTRRSRSWPVPDHTLRPKPIDDGEWIRGIIPKIMAELFRFVKYRNSSRVRYYPYINIILTIYIYI